MTNVSNLSSEVNWNATFDEHQDDQFSIPKLPNQFLFVSRIVIALCGIPSNIAVLAIFSRCRRLHLPRHTCWMAVTVTALLCLVFAVIELIAADFPTRSSYTFLLYLKGTPFAFFSLAYCLVAVERFLAVNNYLWHKDHVTNRVVVLAFTLVGFLVLAGVLFINCLPKKAHYFMPGNGVSTWKLLLLGVTVMTASFIGIVLQILTYRRVQQLYRDHPTLRRMDQHLFQVRYQQHPVGDPALPVKVTCGVTTPSSRYSYEFKSRASRRDLEAGFYYFIVSIPVLISNGVTGLGLTLNYFCSRTELAEECHRFISVLVYVRTFQLFVTACNPVFYFTLSSEFRSACYSKFAITRHTKS